MGPLDELDALVLGGLMVWQALGSRPELNDVGDRNGVADLRLEGSNDARFEVTQIVRRTSAEFTRHPVARRGRLALKVARGGWVVGAKASARLNALERDLDGLLAEWEKAGISEVRYGHRTEAAALLRRLNLVSASRVRATDQIAVIRGPVEDDDMLLGGPVFRSDEETSRAFALALEDELLKPDNLRKLTDGEPDRAGLVVIATGNDVAMGIQLLIHEVDVASTIGPEMPVSIDEVLVLARELPAHCASWSARDQCWTLVNMHWPISPIQERTAQLRQDFSALLLGG